MSEEVNPSTIETPEGPQNTTPEEKVPESKKTKKKEEPEIQETTTLHERTIALLSYMSYFAIVPFYLKSESKFCRFHGKQGMVLALIFFLANVVRPVDFLMDLFFIIQVLIFFYMGSAAISGRWKRFPFIYKWACQFEDVLSLKTKEEEEEEMKVRPDEVSNQPPETPQPPA